MWAENCLNFSNPACFHPFYYSIHNFTARRCICVPCKLRMASVSVSTELLYFQKRRVNNYRNEYSLDFWKEVQKRWLVLGVLISVAAAVVAPHAGGVGGVFHTEYVRYLPLSYIYYKAGCYHRYHRRRYDGGLATVVPPVRLLTICVLHAHIVAPALCMLTVEAFKGSGLDHRVVKGAVLSSAGAGCGWVTLALRPAPPTAIIVSTNYILSLVATPLLMVILCGRASVPPLGGILSTILISATPFALGALRQNSNGNNMTTKCNNAAKISALLLLYAECCEKLREAEGTLYVGDVLVTLILVLFWLLTNAAACWLYERCKVLSSEDAIVTASCAIPRCLDTGWEWSAACGGPGLARLPAALLAPAQALLLAVIVTPDDVTTVEDDDETLTIIEREHTTQSSR